MGEGFLASLFPPSLASYKSVSNTFMGWSLGREINKGELAKFLVDRYCEVVKVVLSGLCRCLKPIALLRDLHGFLRDLPFPHACAALGIHWQFISSSLLLRPLTPVGGHVEQRLSNNTPNPFPH